MTVAMMLKFIEYETAEMPCLTNQVFQNAVNMWRRMNVASTMLKLTEYQTAEMLCLIN